MSSQTYFSLEVLPFVSTEQLKIDPKLADIESVEKIKTRVIGQDKLINVIEKFRDYSPRAEKAFYEDGEARYNISWNNYKRDLCDFSEIYPYLLFKLYGAGEDRDDNWILYVNNGKSFFTMAEWVYEEYHPDKLK